MNALPPAWPLLTTFLPQFMHAESVTAARGIVRGSIFVEIAAVTDSAYAFAASALAPAVVGRYLCNKLGRYLSGGVFIGLGLLQRVASLAGRRNRIFRQEVR